MAKEVGEAGDEAACKVLCAMIANVQQGMYGALPALFRKLSPRYCVRLGDPPESRERDRASAPPPATSTARRALRPISRRLYRRS